MAWPAAAGFPLPLSQICWQPGLRSGCKSTYQNTINTTYFPTGLELQIQQLYDRSQCASQYICHGFPTCEHHPTSSSMDAAAPMDRVCLGLHHLRFLNANLRSQLGLHLFLCRPRIADLYGDDVGCECGRAKTKNKARPHRWCQLRSSKCYRSSIGFADSIEGGGAGQD